MDWYAVIVIPSKKVCDFVDRYREKYAKYTGYVIPPHITIYPPFLITKSNEEEIIDSLNKAFQGCQKLKVDCESIDYFEGGRNNVSYFEIDKDSEKQMEKLLVIVTNALKGKVKNVFDDDNYTPGKYTAHMTIAERVPDKVFPKLKKELQSFKGKMEFKVSSVYLYKQKSGSKVWNELARIKF